MSAPYSPYDARLPRESMARAEYIANVLGLSEEGVRLRHYVLAGRLVALAGECRKVKIDVYKKQSASISEQLKNSKFLCFIATVFTFGQVNPGNWKDLVDLHDNVSKDDIPLHVTEQDELLIKERSADIRAVEAWAAQTPVISLQAKAIWNAMGGRRETFPRFVVSEVHARPALQLARYPRPE